MTSRLILISAAAAFALAGGAAMAQPDDWSGPYIGANAGYTWNTTHERGATTANQYSGGTATFSSGRNINGNGFIGGGQLGVNVQHGPVVWGAEGDFDGLWSRKSHINYYSQSGSSASIVTRSLADPDWMASIRGRVGFAADRTFIYGTGGAAFADLHDRASYVYNPGVAGVGPYASYGANGGVHVGWTAGAGVEFMTSHNMTLGAEYRHTDIGGYDVGYGSMGADGVSERFHSHFTDDALLAKVNFKFSNFGHMF